MKRDKVMKTKETKHTPGPWKLGTSLGNDGHGHYEHKIGPSGITIHQHLLGTDIPTIQANASLIAAAPEMFTEIQKQIEWLEYVRPQVTAPESVMLGFDQSIKYLKQIISKAKGEA